MNKHIEAKLALAESFARLAEDMPLERITVNMVVDGIGRHRKTFYYHFADKEQLVVWLFRYDLAQELAGSFPSDALVRPSPEGGDPFAEFPYYLRNIEKSGRIYNAPFFSAVARCLDRRRAYYRRVFSTLGPGTLDQYLRQLYRPALQEDILLLVEREVAAENALVRERIRAKVTANASVDFLAEFYTGAFISRFVERLNYAATTRTAADIVPFENVVHDSLQALVSQEVRKAAAMAAAEGRP